MSLRENRRKRRAERRVRRQAEIRQRLIDSCRCPADVPLNDGWARVSKHYPPCRIAIDGGTSVLGAPLNADVIKRGQP